VIERVLIANRDEVAVRVIRYSTSYVEEMAGVLPTLAAA